MCAYVRVCMLCVGQEHGRHFTTCLEKAVAFLCVVFSRQCLSMVLAVLELTLQSKLDLNSERSACLCLPSAGTNGVCHHHLARQLFLLEKDLEINMLYMLNIHN